MNVMQSIGWLSASFWQKCIVFVRQKTHIDWTKKNVFLNKNHPLDLVRLFDFWKTFPLHLHSYNWPHRVVERNRDDSGTAV